MGRKRNEAERERDRRRIAELYLQGKYQEEIAQELGINQSTVSRDIKYLLEEWRQEAGNDIKQTQAELKQKYLWVWRESTAAWLKSLQDAETTIQELIDAGEGNPGGSQRLKASTKKEGQSGNPALLAQAQAALKAIREMFGVDAAAKVEHGGLGGGPIQIREIIIEIPKESDDSSH